MFQFGSQIYNRFTRPELLRAGLGLWLISLTAIACEPSEPDAGHEAGSDDEFWSELRTGGDWVEYWPSFTELAQNADVAASGRIIAVKSGVMIQGDAPEDTVHEAIFRVEVDELWRGELNDGAFEFTFVVDRDPEQLKALTLPSEAIVIFARRRSDRPNVYRLVNGLGLWASTSRAIVDTPTELDPPIEGIYGEQISTFKSFAEFSIFAADVAKAR